MGIDSFRPQGVLVQPDDPEGLCFPAEVRQALAQLLLLPPAGRVVPDVLLPHPAWLREARVIVGTWGMPRIDEDLLDRMPRLEAVFYAAGTTDTLMSRSAWERGLRVSSAIALNSEPVAQFALAQILFALKLGWHHVSMTRHDRRWHRMSNVPGSHGTQVGIVSLGIIGRRLVELLDPFAVTLAAYDIHRDAPLSERHHLRYMSLQQLFATSQVVSIHAPLLSATRGLIGGDLIRLMPTNAVLINTARGAVIDEASMIRALCDRPDVIALLDVTEPEPPQPDSPLWTMPNVVLTPHIAGAFGRERRRLGEFAVAEVRRYLCGEPLLGEVSPPDRTPLIRTIASSVPMAAQAPSQRLV